MKGKKTIPPMPIVFKLNNQNEQGETYSLLFNSIGALLNHDRASVTSYFDYLNYFTVDSFTLLALRIIEKRNKELNMNQQHLIIFYATLHLMILALGSTKLSAVMISQMEETSVEIFHSNKEEMAELCETTIKELRRDHKNNNAIIVAFAKIDAYTINE